MPYVPSGLPQRAVQRAFDPLGAEAEDLGGDPAQGVELVLVDAHLLGGTDALVRGQRLLQLRQFVELADADQDRLGDAGDEVAQRHPGGELAVEALLVVVAGHVHVVVLEGGLGAVEDRVEVAGDALEGGQRGEARVRGGGAQAPVAAHADAEHADALGVDLRQLGEVVEVAADGALVVGQVDREAVRAGLALAGALDGEGHDAVRRVVALGRVDVVLLDHVHTRTEDHRRGVVHLLRRQVQQRVDVLPLELQHHAAHPSVAQLAEAGDAVVGVRAKGRLAGVVRVEDGVLGAAPHHRGAQIEVGGGAYEPSLLVVGGALLGLPGDGRPRLGQHGAALDEGEDLVEVGVVVAELLHGALGLGVQGVEAALGEGDVQAPVLAGGTGGHGGLLRGVAL